jgi:hypothetical protein
MTMRIIRGAAITAHLLVVIIAALLKLLVGAKRRQDHLENSIRLNI